MALIALNLCVSTRQRKADRIVIEAGGLPCGRRVAVLACLRQAQRNVIWIAGFLKVRQVAADAGGGRPGVFPSRVTSRAIQRGMHSGKSKARCFQVIECHILPVVDRVACLALSRKSRADVVGRSRLLERPLMAGVTLDGKALKLSDRFTPVTIRAIQSGVTTHQGKAIVVLFYSLVNDAPTLHGVTLFAIRAHLPAVDISVAIGAVRASVGEDGLGMALRAGDPLVQATQRVAGCIVIKFRNGPDGFPSDRGVAVLAGDGQVAMGASRDRTTALAVSTGRQGASSQPYASRNKQYLRK